MSKTIVKFLKNMPPYNEGEIAGFSEKRAADLVKQEIAAPYTPHEDSGDAQSQSAGSGAQEQPTAPQEPAPTPPSKGKPPKQGSA